MSADINNGSRADDLASLIESARKMPGIFEAQAIYEHVEACEAVIAAALGAVSSEVTTVVSNRTC